MVERHLAKVNVASSSLVFRSKLQLKLILYCYMRMLHSGSASAFQADSAGSIPAIRSIKTYCFKQIRAFLAQLDRAMPF